MKSKFGKMLAILLALTMVLSLAACGKRGENETTTTLQETTLGSDETTSADGGTTNPDETTSEGETTTAAEPESTTEAIVVPAGLPEGNAEILAAYTAVMNKAKIEDKPGFKRAEFQELPNGPEYRDISGGKAVINPLLNIAGRFMTTEEKARKEPHSQGKGENMWAWPIRDAPKGCMLTDVNAIKSANCTQLPNGDYKIVIVQKNEKNPEHHRPHHGNSAPSKIGGMFMPLSKSDVDPELAKLDKIIKDAQYDMEYYNCKATLIYDPKTLHVKSVDHILYNKITMSGRVVGISAAGWQVLIMHYQIFDVVY